MKAWLIQIDAYDGATATTLRMASHDDDRLCHLDGQTWWPVIAKLPTLRYDFFDGSFDGGSITSPSGTLEANIEAIPSLPRLAIHDARIRIWGGELGDAFSSFVLTFDGRVKEQPSVDGGAMSISFGADDSWLDQPMLATYAGTGGAEGGTDLEGQVKTLALGAPRFVPATLVDAVDNIYQLSGYGTLNGFEVAFERLNRFGAPSANAATFAALKSGVVTRGQWATCRAQGFVKFGAPPEGLLSFHIQGDAVGGWSRLPGDIIRRIATIAGGAARLSAADVAALNAARPWQLSIVVNAQTTARELIQRIAMSVNAVAYVDWLGVLRLSAIGIGAASMTIAADGSSLPPVADVQQVETSAPYWKIAQGAAVTWQVHGLNDIAFSAPLNPRGPYDPDETYREGDMVTLPNGSQWLFVGATPAKGSAPADNNPNWFRLSDAITAANVTYGDGTTVEALKPAEPGATVGAPPGTPISTVTSDDVLAALMAVASVTDPNEIVAGALALIDRTQNHALALFDAQLLGEERKARWDRLTHLDGVEITTSVRQEITRAIESEMAIIEVVNAYEVAATDGISAAMAAISDEASLRASADMAETAQRELAISLVQTRIDDEVIDLQAAILTEATTRADAIAAETNQREIAMSAMQSELDGQVTALQASIEAEASTRASEDAAETAQRELAISTLQGVVDGQIADVTAAISSEASTRATAIAAETLAREQAISEIETTIDGEISTVMAAIASEASTRATADEAEASQREALAASIASDLADVNAAILNEASVRATGDEAEATAREALAATLSGDISDVSAAVETEATARAAEDGALASLISGVQTTVDGHTASVALLLESVDGLNSRLVARVVSGDMIGGFELAAGGGEIDANFLVDNFRVLSPSGGDGWQFSDGRQVTTGGTIMTIIGAPFGSSNQFLEWTGPIVSTYEECTEANAIKYMKIDGSAYFGGGLSSGILKNEATSNVVSSTAFVTVGPFTSNGNTVNININARYYREYQADSGTGGITGSGSGVITVEHSTDGTNWTSIGTMGVAESLREVIVDGEPGVPDVIQWEMSGAGTLIWNPGPLSGLFIRARWTSRLFPAFNGTPLFGTEERQSVTIIAVETP